MLSSFIDELKVLPNLRDEEFYCYSITLYGHSKMMDRAIKAFVEMDKWGVKRSTKSLNALLSAGNFAKKYFKVSRIFYEFPDKYGIKPDLDTYNIVIESFVDSSKPESVFGIFEEMDKNGVEPDEITLNTALSGFNRQQKYLDAEKVLKMFEKLGPQLGLHIYNNKIRTLCDMGKTMEAKAVFEEISSRGMKLNGYTYQCLVFAYYMEENVEETRRFFNEMHEKGFVPDFRYSTYKKIVQFLCGSGDFETAFKVFFCGLSENYTFDGVTLLPLFEGLKSIGRVDLADKLVVLVPYVVELWKLGTK
ncbi:Pentatricopeptide repeat-containing protein [Thalictrum thalictroides]|uniref:Pentatricopeptide repeat-containing protein n=1 Tax=Thalictrum thalictroides TaxID=46969 RepID=A0A7J6VCP3_THATH|nr:Pentatricopeptide repeat-containing protein [Thalictrum thalictroides]